MTTPIIARSGAGVGPFATAALLYLGAAASSIVLRVGARSGAPLRRADAPRIALIAIAGAAIAPALLAWGLQRTGATTGSLLLNLEAVFTVALARVIVHEHVGRRVALAVAALAGGGAVLVLGRAGDSQLAMLGMLAVAGATLAWSVDNVVMRPLAERDPLTVVAAKCAIGAVLSSVVAAIAGDALPPWRTALILLGCGATGFGLSLRLYLLAQRRIGAARTGSVFALAPFVGAVIAIAWGDRAFDGWTAVAAGMFGLGVYLHVTERHHHAHLHAAVEHEHMHRHDDAHHTHTHDPPFVGEHSHPHHHDPLQHDHDHAPDMHHDHH